jgi:hypothetical protein
MRGREATACEGESTRGEGAREEGARARDEAYLVPY